jgi:hypothetical protein
MDIGTKVPSHRAADMVPSIGGACVSVNGLDAGRALLRQRWIVLLLVSIDARGQ